MQVLDADTILGGKDEVACVQIAQRTGACLSRDDTSDADRRAAELIACALAEDAIERVRCELSKAIRHAKYLPRDLALKVAHDVDSVACPFLEVTEVFSAADWQQLILTISRNAQVAVARRSSMPEYLARLLAELGDNVVAETLVENPMAPMTEPVCDVLVERFISEVWVLDKLASRDDLLVEVALNLTARVSAAARRKLSRTYQLPDFTEPVAAEAEVTALLKTVDGISTDASVSAAESLHTRGKLTPLLILTGLRQRQIRFVEVALSVKAARSLAHVRSVIQRADPDAVYELLKRAHIPDVMHGDFWTEIETLRAG